MNTVCASSVVYGEEAFSCLGKVEIIPEKEILPTHLTSVDALITRSKVSVNRSLLENSSVTFVGTATAGMDHINQPDMEALGVHWTAAPGCNANSVAEYVFSGLLHLAQKEGFQLDKKTLGIIGVGEVGSRVARKAQALGMGILQNDPPKKTKNGDLELISVNDLIHASDIITVHVPLTYKGPHPTFHMHNRDFFQRLKPETIYINSCRGEVSDTEALLEALKNKSVSHAIMDVWENEPVCPLPLLKKATLATPHIAGYSLEGRANGTSMVFDKARAFFGIDKKWNWETMVNKPDPITLDAHGLTHEATLSQVVRQAYNIEEDVQAFRALFKEEDQERGKRFSQMRAAYKTRREFTAFEVKIKNATPESLALLQAFGFRIVPV